MPDELDRQDEARMREIELYQQAANEVRERNMSIAISEAHAQGGM